MISQRAVRAGPYRWKIYHEKRFHSFFWLIKGRLWRSPKIYRCIKNPVLVPFDLCSSFKLQQPAWSSTYPSSPTPLCPTAPCTGHRWLLEFDSRHWYLPTVLQMNQAHPMFRPCSHHTPSPPIMLCCCKSAWFSLTMRGVPATTQQNHDYCQSSTMVKQKMLHIFYCDDFMKLMFLQFLGFNMVQCTYCKSLWIVQSD